MCVCEHVAFESQFFLDLKPNAVIAVPRRIHIQILLMILFGDEKPHRRQNLRQDWALDFGLDLCHCFKCFDLLVLVVVVNPAAILGSSVVS